MFRLIQLCSALLAASPAVFKALAQNAPAPASSGGVPIVLETSKPAYFNLTLSEGISEMGAWLNNLAFAFSCDNGLVGPQNPELCVNTATVNMSSSVAGNISFVLDTEQLDNLKSVKVDDESVYVYVIPLSKYAAPNALYETADVAFAFSSGENFSYTSDPVIFNYFNASAASLREYYGVDPELMGSEEMIQGSTLFFGQGESAVNTTAVNEYLELQGLVPNIPLQLSDWATGNNVSVCLNNGNCIETMLDVQAQQAFVPQAVTFFAPTEMLPAVKAVSEVKEFLKKRGYSSDLINEVANAAVEFLKSNITAAETDFSKIKGLDTTVQNNLADFATSYYQNYFLEFINNVTTSEERVQVVSLSWSAGYLIDEEILEGALKNLTLSGISILVSSGDAGASGNHAGQTDEEKCFPADDPLTSNQPDQWPINSPWVTIVGGTQMMATEEYPEGTQVVASSLTSGGVTSGGGFVGSSYPSKLYSMPVWQKKFAERYLSENNASTFAGFPTKDTPGFNTTRRAFPDIAMYAAYFPILDAAGVISPESGTSLAAPMAAAMFTLANQKLLADGYEVIGYANPMIYWMGENCTDAFQDITVGNNQGGDNRKDCLFGYPAAPGWDPVTGFGTINFGPFVDCAKRYQDEVRSQGLEVLPDGTLNTAAASSGGNGDAGSSTSSKPHSSAVGLASASSMIVASVALLAGFN